MIPVKFIRRKNINNKIQENKQSMKKPLLLCLPDTEDCLHTSPPRRQALPVKCRQEEFGQISATGNKFDTTQAGKRLRTPSTSFTTLLPQSLFYDVVFSSQPDYRPLSLFILGALGQYSCFVQSQRSNNAAESLSK